MGPDIRRDAGTIANLAAAGLAGLTLASAAFVFPLGWFGVVVTSVALALGSLFCALAALKLWARSAGRATPAPAVAAGRQPR